MLLPNGPDSPTEANSTGPTGSDENLSMPIHFALLTAFANALNVVTQHKVSITAAEHFKGWKFVV